MGTLIERLGHLVYLDANVVVYALEGYAQYEPVIRPLLEAMDRDQIRAATSDLTLAEVLVKPLRDGNAALQRAYREFLRPTQTLQVASVTREILIRAAELRASTSLRLPDAIHVATAESLGCDSLLTNDRALRSATGVPTLLLCELVAESR